MSSIQPIMLYDIPCNTPGLPWSPNTMAVRYSLGYKGLPFTTVWVELQDIATVLKSKCVPPQTADPNSAAYTLPAIEDPNTGGTIVIDSLKIGNYLDETYPDTPKVATEEAMDLFVKAGDRLMLGAASKQDKDVLLVISILCLQRLSLASQEFYHGTRIPRYGRRWTSMVEASSRPGERAALVRRAAEASKATWEGLEALYDETPGAYVLGEEPCMFDFAVAGRIKYVVDGIGMEVIKDVMQGRWGTFVESLEKYFKY